MLHVQYDITPGFMDKLQVVKINVAGLLPSLSSLIKRYSFKTGIVDKINKTLTKIFIYSEGLQKVVLKNNDPKEAEADYPQAKKTLFRYVRLIAHIEKAHYFYNNVTPGLCEGILDNFYAIESHLRRTAYSNKKSDGRDKELTEFASHVSLKSIAP
jgi:hypothetical protein